MNSLKLNVSQSRDMCSHAAYNKHKQVEEEHNTLERQSRIIDVKIAAASADVQRLLKLRKRQVDKQ